MAVTTPRKSPRALISIIARYRSPSIFEFVNEQCYDLSQGGMFIKSDNPVNPGTLLKLECLIDDSPDVIQGVARVVWVRRENRADGPSGMGVKFIRLDSGSPEIIERLVEKAASISMVKEPVDQSSEQCSEGLVEQAATIDSQRPSEIRDDIGDAQEIEKAASISGVTEPVDDSDKQRSESLVERAAIDSQQPSEPREDKRDVQEFKSAKPVREPAEIKSVSDASKTEQRSSVSTSLEPPPRSSVFPKWAIAVGAIAVIAIGYVAFYNGSENDDASRINQNKPEKESPPAPSASAEKPANRAESASQQEVKKPLPRESESVSGNNQKVESKQETVSSVPVEKENATESKKLTAANDSFLLTVTTNPVGAQIEVNGQTITSPGTLNLGKVTAPFILTAQKENFVFTRVKVDTSVFEKEENNMVGLVHLNLAPQPESPEKVENPQRLKEKRKPSHENQASPTVETKLSEGEKPSTAPGN
jgi:uncharacterized protein (TIGR02266 family)